MSKEWKICLPAYKIVYSLCFIVILAIIRGISHENQIGAAIQANMGALALIFCADTYECEYTGKRWEVFQLRPGRYQTRAVRRRLLIELTYLCVLSFVGYGLFYCQKPQSLGAASSLELYLPYLVAAAASVIFWGILSMALAGLLHNMLAGIAVSLVLWLVINSKIGDQFLGKWSVFAYTFRDISQSGDYSWLCGTILAILLAAVMVGALPLIIKIRNK